MFGMFNGARQNPQEQYQFGFLSRSGTLFAINISWNATEALNERCRTISDGLTVATRGIFEMMQHSETDITILKGEISSVFETLCWLSVTLFLHEDYKTEFKVPVRKKLRCAGRANLVDFHKDFQHFRVFSMKPEIISVFMHLRRE